MVEVNPLRAQTEEGVRSTVSTAVDLLLGCFGRLREGNHPQEYVPPEPWWRQLQPLQLHWTKVNQSSQWCEVMPVSLPNQQRSSVDSQMMSPIHLLYQWCFNFPCFVPNIFKCLASWSISCQNWCQFIVWALSVNEHHKLKQWFALKM